MAIKQADIDSAGGDWAGYGELDGQQLIALMQENKLSVVFANDAVLLDIENTQGQRGTYTIKHQPFQ